MSYANADRQRKAQHQSYLRNKGRVREASKKSRRRSQEIVRKAKDVPCADCGARYPHYVMDFDHMDPKSKLITVAKATASRGVPKLLEEMAKCEVVCSNCHRIRTWKDFDFEVE